MTPGEPDSLRAIYAPGTVADLDALLSKVCALKGIPTSTADQMDLSGYPSDAVEWLSAFNLRRRVLAAEEANFAACGHRWPR